MTNFNALAIQALAQSDATLLEFWPDELALTNDDLNSPCLMI